MVGAKMSECDTCRAILETASRSEEENILGTAVLVALGVFAAAVGVGVLLNFTGAS